MTGLGQIGALGRLGAPALARGGWWLSGSELDLDFANNRAFNRSTGFNGSPNGILTYTSPSPKMVYGDDGVLRYAPHNLCLRSQSLATSPWSVDNSGAVNPTVTENYAAAPDGTLTATRVQLNKTGGTYSRLQQLIAGTQIATFSVYMKTTSAPSANVGIRIDQTGVNCAVTDEWQRFSVSLATAGTTYSSQILLYDSIPGNDETADILVWGAQTNRGPTALTYIPTTTAAVYSLPIDHNPTTFAPLGVLIEEQRTNLLTYSEQFDNAAWTKNRTTVSANAAAAPDGTTTADKLVEDTSVTIPHETYSTSGITLTAAAYTASVFLKSAERTKARVTLSTAGSALGAYVVADLAAGTLAAVTNLGAHIGGTATIQELLDGWYRVSLTITGTSASYFVSTALITGTSTLSYTGDGTSGIYIWGAQLEAGAFPTSYIPTVASQVTRAADQVSILTSAFGYSATEGTAVVQSEKNSNSFREHVSIDNGTVNERLVLYTSSGQLYFFASDGGVAQLGASGLFTTAPGTLFKAAIAWKLNDAAYVRDGSTVATDTSITLPTVTKLNVGQSCLGTLQICSHLKRLTYFPTRKTDAELQALTA